MNFEASLKRLDELVQQLEKGDLTLEKSLACFEEGLALAKKLEKTLDEAEGRIEKLLDDGSREDFEVDREESEEGEE